MLWRRSAMTMPSRGWVAKVCATKIATSGRENIKTKWPPKSFFFVRLRCDVAVTFWIQYFRRKRKLRPVDTKTWKQDGRKRICRFWCCPKGRLRRDGHGERSLDMFTTKTEPVEATTKSQMVEKILEVQGSMALGFVDLEKAFDTVPREMVMATLRWMGVPEAEVRMVEGTYEKTTARMVVGEGASEEFEVKIGLRQGSVLSPLLFIPVLDLISRKTVVKDAMKKLLYADDLALVANDKQELQETMEEWNGLFTKHGLKLNLEKTEVLHIGHQREELDIVCKKKLLE